jgi:hypothetical protein
MAFHGDNLGVLFAAGIGCLEMPTAICRVHTREGFVIAADGLKTRHDDDGRIVGAITENAQKIFPIDGRQIAYSLTGIYALTPLGSEEVVFDFESEIPKCARALAEKDPPTMYHYVEKLCSLLRQSLGRVKRHRRNVYFPSGDQTEPPGATIVRIFFDGYYKGEADRMYARFFHENQKLRTLVLQDDFYRMRGSGSLEVVELARGGDPRFAKYRIPANSFLKNATLSDAIQIAKNCILAQCDPEARKVDEICSAIGGNVHIATITHASGFQWTIPPR